MEKKEKKIYEKPEIEVINLLNQEVMLFGSDETDEDDPFNTPFGD